MRRRLKPKLRSNPYGFVGKDDREKRKKKLNGQKTLASIIALILVFAVVFIWMGWIHIIFILATAIWLVNIQHEINLINRKEEKN